METLGQLFEETLRDILYAEKAILKALPKMAKKASSQNLAAAFEEHRKQTEGQVDRLEQIFKMLGKTPRGKKCAAIEGLTELRTNQMSRAPWSGRC
jgi:ferritin-like metal-binding protein YciE